jgi:23S rRNA (cytosine1962-C5)-methyltransferase
VYRDHVPRGFQAPTGTWVRIVCGNWSGYAVWDATSPIALRVYSERQIPDAAWVRARVQEAWQAREPLRASGTSAYRCLFGEGDLLPGITADIYGNFAVIVTYSTALDALVPLVAEALTDVAQLQGVARRRRSESDEPAAAKLERISGRLPPRELIVEEHGVRLTANLHEGQKTGLFLDHRENRRFVRTVAAGRRVLNLFSYTGAFSVSAVAGGASRVTSVDIAEPAAAAARHNFEINGFSADDHDFEAMDAFEFLERENSRARRFDLVVCDPPSFAKSRDQLPQAVHAYTRLTTMALRVTELGGLYAAASCTSQVSPEAFKEMLGDAARRAKRRLQIVHEAGHPLDHPVLAAHREGRYLKFVVSRVLPIV